VVNNAKFYKSSLYEIIVTRAFDLNDEGRESAIHILETGELSSVHVDILNKSGLWNMSTNWFLSNLLLSYLFQTVKENQNATQSSFDQIDTLEKVLIYGLSQLKEDDFYETDFKTKRYENAIGTIFAMNLSKISHLYISPQTQIFDKNKKKGGSKPTIDFFLNGRLSTYLELTRDGLDLEKHFDKFEQPTGSYNAHKDHYAILDFSLSSLNPTELPTKYNGMGNKMYSFVKMQNTLYKGNEAVLKGVSKFLKSPGVRTFSTVLKHFR
jgi:hypothetical protein